MKKAGAKVKSTPEQRIMKKTLEAQAAQDKLDHSLVIEGLRLWGTDAVAPCKRTMINLGIISKAGDSVVKPAATTRPSARGQLALANGADETTSGADKTPTPCPAARKPW